MTSRRTLILTLGCALLLGVLMTTANITTARPFMSPPDSPPPTPVPGSIVGTVTRQGTPANPNPGGGTWACVAVTANGATTYGPAYTDATGLFGIENLDVYTYTLIASYPGYLTADKSEVVVDGQASTFLVGTAHLLGGDVNGDNAVNILDIATMAAKFDQSGFPVRSNSIGCAGADEASDINDDGSVNIIDLAIGASNWNRVGPTPWGP